MTQQKSSLNNPIVIFGGVAVSIAIITALVGYIVGTTLERNVAEDDLDAVNNTLSAVQILATEAIDALSTNEAALVESYEGTLTVAQTEVSDALATREAEATEAISAITATIGAQQTFTISAQQTATVEQYFTATALANGTPEAAIRALSASVRLGPSIEYPIIDTITQDTIVNVLGISADGEWAEISYRRDDEPIVGFVRAEFVDLIRGNLSGVPIAADFPTLTPMPSPSQTPTPPFTQAEITAVSATVYSGPGDHFSVVGILRFSDVVTVQGVTLDGQWLLIESQDLSGYIRANAIRLLGGNPEVEVLPTSTPTVVLPTASPTLPSTPEAVAAGQFIVVRAGPDEDFDVLGIVSANEPLQIVGVSQDGLWFKVIYTNAPDGFGWVSGEVVRVSGNLANLPIVEGPPLPTQVSQEIRGSAAPSSAGATTSVSISPLPEASDIISYDQMNFTAYSYELVVAVNGTQDNRVFETFFIYRYTDDLVNQNLNIRIDGSGRLLDVLASDEDFEFIRDFSPLEVGVQGDQSYFASESNGGLCFELGEDLTRQDFLDAFSGISNTADVQGLLAILPDNVVFGRLEDGGLVGLGGNHYQLLGVEEDGQIVPLDDFKIDLWYSEDESMLYAYRVTIRITPETYPRFQNILIDIDPDFENVSVFDGDLTFYFLPVAINEIATEQALAPENCNFIQ